ncbi:FkbM family methyltransferase [Bradyrhizobium acaciae]|uniref:FkbM family methyltransferase n=1 Tax=Bradyrhizobium acaciae TaxID=2683706 RepID=UPI001E4B4121|nr:FkbM family methyltransferase [Bradyrhizobium acaciae]MCC8977603.1 FkbM family methyltransferase [Bradyrhizobium acaciae]
MEKIFKALREGGASLLFRRIIWVLSDKFPLFPPSVTLFGTSLSGNHKLLGKVINDVVVGNQYHIELIKKGGVVVDAGAHVGVFSLFVAEMNPDAKIYAFEPTPSTFKYLKENTEGRPNIHCFNYGLGDKNETTSIVETNNAAGNYIGKKGAPGPVKTAAASEYTIIGETPCEIKTLDSLNLPQVDFIKMDVEGFESKLLMGAKETIRKYKPIISMSAYHKPEDKTELPAILNSIAPYTCVLHTEAEEDFVCKPN